MQPSHSPELGASADELLDTLLRYRSATDALVRRWEVDRYMQSSELFDQMRAIATSLRGVQVAWVELMLARFELLDALWQARTGGVPPAEVDRLQQAHGRAVQRFDRVCRQRA